MTDTKPSWIDRMTEEQRQAKEKRLSDLKEAQLKYAQSRPLYRPIELTDSWVMYARTNKHELSIRDIAVKARASVAHLKDALYGVTFKHLNETHPPWPSPEQYKKNPNAWKEYHDKCWEIKRKKKEAKKKRPNGSSDSVHPWRVKGNPLNDKKKKAWHMK